MAYVLIKFCRRCTMAKLKDSGKAALFRVYEAIASLKANAVLKWVG